MSTINVPAKITSALIWAREVKEERCFSERSKQNDMNVTLLLPVGCISLEDMLPHSVKYWNFSSAIPTKKKQNKQYFNRVDREVKTYTMSWCSPLKWSPKEKWATSELTSANMIPFFLLSAARRGSQSRTQPKKKVNLQTNLKGERKKYRQLHHWRAPISLTQMWPTVLSQCHMSGILEQRGRGRHVNNQIAHSSYSETCDNHKRVRGCRFSPVQGRFHQDYTSNRWFRLRYLTEIGQGQILQFS